ncbi:unnamed protein product [Cryptosporidium hominis]|uniref:Uncharacterized protein n=1 Tax=Cryptosporidium hominis TaxID=237895 RepID=A0A0S4TDT6_CRYHO|nr:hypothetical protein ChTU502y2012_384g0230 [Cryptosporidium hominis]PPA62847.1 hypothetical protein ChUKH1_14275 [Cryptosporidium hominis]PPS92470.1 Uncharacterized protein GY17_00003921 [Cryptosporidium hominis]CUV04842.1 unnamed protein product [Cryptosporidium hominis]|eukprot:PPS92470.1 Uncharacterized protein GY17_00003921 [Cryptosporidium hominis]
MGTKLVSNIKNFIISGRNQNGIKGLVKGSYPNGYRNFGPDLDRMMLPLNKKYVDESKLVDSINEEINSIGGCSTSGGGKDNYYLSVLKCLVEFIQWDIKKERENYAKYGMFLFLKLLEGYKDHWVDSIRLTAFIRSQSEAWLSKDSGALQYYGKWIILGNMKRSLEKNSHLYYKEFEGLSNDGTHIVSTNPNIGQKYPGLSANSLPIKMCTLSNKLVEMLCKCVININNKLESKNGKEKDKLKGCKNSIITGEQSLKANEVSNKDLIEVTLILEIILLGFLMEGETFEEKSGALISEFVIPSLASIIDSKLILSYCLSFHNVKYYLNENGPGRSLYNTMEIFREDSNLFFQGDKATINELIESLYMRFLYLIETLSIIFLKEFQEEKAMQQRCSDTISGKVTSEIEDDSASQSTSLNNFNNNINNNELGLIQRFKVQDRINILPLKFKSLNDKLYSLCYYPYILTSDICLSICRGNSDYTVELITLLTCALRYHTINTGYSEDFQRLFQNTDPFFIIDELMVSISGGNDEIPRSILYYETPQYCYSLLRCLHRVLCCCPRIVGISRLVSTLINLIDVILPLYDLNGTLCSRSKNFDGQLSTIGNNRGGMTGGDIGKCALLMRNVAFQVVFDIMCILSDTSQVFYVIRVLVKVRDWCGSCLLDLIRRCQRLASQNSETGNLNKRTLSTYNSQLKSNNIGGVNGLTTAVNQKYDKLDLRTRVGATGLLQTSNKKISELGNVNNTSEGSKLVQNSSLVGGTSGSVASYNSGIDLSSYLNIGGLREFDLEIVNPSFWSASKILEIAGINRKWITGQIGNSGNNYISMNFTGGGVGGGGMINGLNGNNSSNMSISSGISSGLSSDIIVSSKTTQVIFNRSENMGSNNSGSSGLGGALRTDVIGGSTKSIPSTNTNIITATTNATANATATTSATNAATVVTSSTTASSPSAIAIGVGNISSSGSSNYGSISSPKAVALPSSNYCYDYSSEDEENEDYDFDDIDTSSDEDKSIVNFKGSERRRGSGRYKFGGGYAEEDRRRGEEEDDDSDNSSGEDGDDDYWEADQKLLELIRLRPTSSIINAQPPTAGILRRTVSSDVSISKGTFSKIGSISSLWTKHNSSPPKALSSMKRVCFAEVAQIY